MLQSNRISVTITSSSARARCRSRQSYCGRCLLDSRLGFIHVRCAVFILLVITTLAAHTITPRIFSFWREHAALDRLRREWPETPLWEDFTKEPGPPGEPSILKGTRIRWIGLVNVEEMPPPPEFKRFSKFESLKALNISGTGTELTKEHFECLPVLPTVEEFDLSFCGGVTDNRLKTLVERVPNLRTLDLQGTAITDKCIGSIARLEHLNSLSLAKTGITGSTLHQLRKCSLKKLILDDTKVDTQALNHIIQLSGLRKLSISDTPIDRDSLHRLGDLDSLRTLILFDNPMMGGKELQELQDSLPKCRIEP